MTRPRIPLVFLAGIFVALAPGAQTYAQQPAAVPGSFGPNPFGGGFVQDQQARPATVPRTGSQTDVKPGPPAGSSIIAAPTSGATPVPPSGTAPAAPAPPAIANVPVSGATPAPTPASSAGSAPLASSVKPPPKAAPRRAGSALDAVQRRLGVKADDGKTEPGKAGAAVSAKTNSPAGAGADDDEEGVPPLSSSAQMLRAQGEGYNGARPRMYPMTPGMIGAFRKEYEAQQDAAFGLKRPRPIIDASSISLEPGAPASTIHLAPGIVSTIEFSDATGAPWPFTGYMVGNKDAVDVVKLGEENLLLSIAPKMQAGSTNLTVALKPPGEGQRVAPVSFTLVIDRAQAHYRHDVRVQALGPNGKKTPLAIDKTVGSRPGDESLLRVLAGTDMPAGARPLALSFQDHRQGLDARAWLIGGQIYIRSRLTMISPSYADALSGVDDMHVYRIAASAKAVLFSTEGRIVAARIGD